MGDERIVQAGGLLHESWALLVEVAKDETVDKAIRSLCTLAANTVRHVGAMLAPLM